MAKADVIPAAAAQMDSAWATVQRNGGLTRKQCVHMRRVNRGILSGEYRNADAVMTEARVKFKGDGSFLAFLQGLLPLIQSIIPMFVK